MSKSTTFLNYSVLLLLYITAFIILYVKNTEIIGFYFLFIVVSASTIYNISYFNGLPIDLNLIPKMISISIIISGMLHIVALIFIIMMISNMRLKYSDTYGTPIKLPPIYKDRLDEFKTVIVTVFCVCAFLLITFMVSFDSINIVFSEKMVRFSDIMQNGFPLSILIISFYPIVISGYQVSTANSFSILNRQQLMR